MDAFLETFLEGFLEFELLKPTISPSLDGPETSFAAARDILATPRRRLFAGGDLLRLIGFFSFI